MQKIGASQETDIGEIQSQSGHQMIWKRLFVLDQSKSFKNFLVVERLKIFIESILITLPSHPSKAKVF